MFNLGKNGSEDCIAAFRCTEVSSQRKITNFSLSSLEIIEDTIRLKLQQGRSWLGVKNLF